MLKPWQAKVVWYQGTNDRLVMEENNNYNMQGCGN